MLTSEIFIDCLEHIFPCTGLIYVGAGNGSALYDERYSRISRLLAIEADNLAFSYLASNLQNRTGWTALKALVGENEAETIFFTASNPNESGLLNPGALKSIWPNLTCLSSRPQASTTLSSVLKNQSQANRYNWLRVDCLPSVRILRGLDKHIEQFDVIDVRLLDHAVGIPEEGCTKAGCDTLLTPLGFRMIFVEEATNPMLQRILYVRDGRAILELHIEHLNQRYQFENEQLTQAKVAAEKTAGERAQQLVEANTVKDEQVKLLIEHLKRIGELQTQIQSYQLNEYESSSRMQRFKEELAGAEAQLELMRSEVPVLNLDAQIERCLAAHDTHAAIDNFLTSGHLSDAEKIDAYFMLSNAFSKKGDKITALHFLRAPMEHGLPLDEENKGKLISRLIEQGRADLASDITIDDMLEKQVIGGLGAKELSAVKAAYLKTVEQRGKKSEHGHDLLLNYLKKNLGEYKKSLAGRKLILIEIGTTRENVPGQGSTRKIAEFCNRNGVDFITVDMDPHNTRMASEMFSRLGFNCQAVTAKGEDYLRACPGGFDFIFLDAYDFDHGQHSDLRQSRYEKFLGSPIDDAACHQMHLDCAQSVETKLAENGIVCVDDTWLENGAWKAKGTLAMPYLIDQGFVVLEARNRAALLVRKTP